jgi:ABC-type multidrug transport system fused ATPase/permease subunit
VEILACLTAIVIISLQYGNYVLLLVMLGGLPLLILPIMLITRRVRKTYRNSFKKIADVTSRMHEVFTGIMVVKAYNMEEAEHVKFNSENRKYVRATIRAMKLQLLMEPIMEIVSVGG